MYSLPLIIIELEGVYLRGSPFVAVSEEEGRLLASALVLWGLPHSTQLGTVEGQQLYSIYWPGECV